MSVHSRKENIFPDPDNLHVCRLGHFAYSFATKKGMRRCVLSGDDKREWPTSSALLFTLSGTSEPGSSKCGKAYRQSRDLKQFLV